MPSQEKEIKRIYHNIRQVAEMTGYHPKTIRHYNKCFGLAYQYDINKCLRFSDEAVRKLKWIKQLSESGYFTLEGIGAVINKRLIIRLPSGTVKG